MKRGGSPREAMSLPSSTRSEGAEWIRTFRGTRNERSDDGGGSLENNESKVGQFGRFIFGSFGLFELALRKHTFLVHVVPVALDIAFLAYVRRTYEYSEYIISYV